MAIVSRFLDNYRTHSNNFHPEVKFTIINIQLHLFYKYIMY